MRIFVCAPKVYAPDYPHVSMQENLSPKHFCPIKNVSQQLAACKDYLRNDLRQIVLGIRDSGMIILMEAET